MTHKKAHIKSKHTLVFEETFGWSRTFVCITAITGQVRRALLTMLDRLTHTRNFKTKFCITIANRHKLCTISVRYTPVTLSRIDSRIYGISRYERYVTRTSYIREMIRSSYSSIRSSYSSYAEVLRFLSVHLKIRSTYVAGPIRRTYVTHTWYIRRKQRGRYAVDT